ncbi:hypothetical protein B9Z19DRAFT_1152276 [Tuber borchii]|uniref:Beta/gamma crystallin 'Greek key' domain-containing protein n=1 Tax=Tuber borchii TaxID=42251 RepID=A0A2T6ZJY2_TUBBO|nr:hypothetical protein B9Z19DRAFT_1152276 [Tuber borchii]
MQPKIFLSSLLATLLVIGVIATPTGVGARDIKSSHSLDGIATPFQEIGTDVGETKPPPKGPTIIPKDNDVPVVSTSVEARDLESLKKRTLGCVFATDGPNFTGYFVYICPVAINGGCNNWNIYWRYHIRSFGPDQGTWCQIFTDPNCGGTMSAVFTYPGYGNLGIWDMNMGSFRCWW